MDNQLEDKRFRDNTWNSRRLNLVKNLRPTFSELDVEMPLALDIYVSMLYTYHARQIAAAWIDEIHTSHALLVPEQIGIWKNVIADLEQLKIEVQYDIVDEAILEVQASIEELTM